jgi:PAS domain S-box-containing protein
MTKKAAANRRPARVTDAGSAFRPAASRPHEAVREYEERPGHSDTKLAQRLVELEKVNAEVEDARRAALNLMEDAVQSRRTAERLNAELRTSEERFRRIFNSSNDAILVADPAHHFIMDANGTACRMLGYTRRELLSLPMSAIYPDAMPELNDFAQSVFNQGQGWTDTLSCRARTGAVIPCEISASPIELQGKTYMLALMRDITERRRAENALRESERRFREMIDALPTAIYTTDAEGRLTHFNPAAVELTGRAPELGTDRWCVSWKLYHADGTPMPHDECPMAIALKEGRAVRGAEAILERPDGRRVWFMPYPTPMRDAEGRVVGGINMLVDITERKQAEMAAASLAAIVESSGDAIISKDLNGVIMSWNKGAERLFGYTAEEAVGQPVTMLIPADRDHEEPEILARLRRGERVDHFETVRVRKDASPLHVSLTISPIKDAKGRVVGASKIGRDITERKRNEEQIAMLAGEAEHRAKNVLATVLATVHLTQSDTPDGLKRAIAGRIQALANVHQLFVKSRWTGADLRNLATQELSPYCADGDGRVRIGGPDQLLEPNKAQTVAVIVHELATNAAKYGALSIPKGRVEVEWARDADGRLVLRWIETDGPPVKPPTRQGFGTRVVERMVRGLAGEIRFNWRAEGLACEIVLPAED